MAVFVRSEKSHMSHTKGPWTVDTKTPGGAAWVRTVENNQPCHELALVDAGHLSISQNIANARLMALAPELISVLSDLVNSPNYKSNALWLRAVKLLAPIDGTITHAQALKDLQGGE